MGYFMTSDTLYDISEWLAYNREAVLASIKYYRDNTHLKDQVMRFVAEHFRSIPASDIAEAFEDQRVITVFDFYYVQKRGGKLEH